MTVWAFGWYVVTLAVLIFVSGLILPALDVNKKAQNSGL